jgi:hypothetical protein
MSLPVGHDWCRFESSRASHISQIERVANGLSPLIRRAFHEIAA